MASRADDTPTVKTSVFVPEATVRVADRLANASGKTRSDIFVEALQEYVARHDPDAIVEAINNVADSLYVQTCDFADAANRRVFERNPW